MCACLAASQSSVKTRTAPAGLDGRKFSSDLRQRARRWTKKTGKSRGNSDDFRDILIPSNNNIATFCAIYFASPPPRMILSMVSSYCRPLFMFYHFSLIFTQVNTFLIAELRIFLDSSSLFQGAWNSRFEPAKKWHAPRSQGQDWTSRLAYACVNRTSE